MIQVPLNMLLGGFVVSLLKGLIVVAEPTKENNKYKVKVDGYEGLQNFPEDNIKTINTSEKFPSSIKMVKTFEGTYNRIPRKDLVALVSWFSTRKQNMLSVTPDIAELMQRINIGLKDTANTSSNRSA